MIKLLPFLAIAPLAMMSPAHAGIPDGVFRDSSNNLFVMNQTPGATAELIYSGYTKFKNLTANGCGLASWRGTVTYPVPSAFSINGATIVTFTSLPIQVKPTCSNGVLAEPRTANFRTEAGELVIVTSPGAAVSIGHEATKVRKSKVNTCGVARWSSTQSYPHVEGNGVGYKHPTTMQETLSIEDFPIFEAPICRTDNLLIPASWLN
jgi:hypothetical protein